MNEVTIFDRFDLDDAARRDAAARFREMGWPGRRLEAWHYTDLKPLRDIAFGAAPVADFDKSVLPASDLPRLVFVNGKFHAASSSTVEGFSRSTGADEPMKSDLPLVLLNTACPAMVIPFLRDQAPSTTRCRR